MPSCARLCAFITSAPELSADARIALAVKETGFTEKKVTELVAVGKACEYPVGIVPTDENENAANGTVADELIEDPSVSLFDEVLRSIYRAHFRDAADRIRPKDKQILSLSLGVCFDCFGIFKPSTYAEIALKQGASGEKSIVKKRKAAIEKFAKKLCDMGFCDGVFLKQTDITVIKKKTRKQCSQPDTPIRLTATEKPERFCIPLPGNIAFSSSALRNLI